MKNRFLQPPLGWFLLALVAFLAGTLMVQQPASFSNGHLSAFIQGQIGLSTLKLGNVSIRPISAAITNKTPVCLVMVAVEMQGPAFGVPDGGVFLMGNRRHTYPSTSLASLGQDSFFGQRKVRVFGFNPSELCTQDELKIEDLALLIIQPVGVGVVSFAPLHTTQIEP